jgi:1-acyl-sn-glycerol-3-phosphate acyltransferase
VEFLRKGEGVVVFPEGTYYPNKMGQARTGMIRLILARFSLPFVPVGLHYGKADGQRTKVRIQFGTPIFATNDRSPQEFTDRAMREIATLSGLEYTA